MTNIKAWRFLVGRNQYLDYRTVVAPSFMCEAGASSILAKVAEGDLTEKGFAIYREIYNSKAGNFTLVFRVIEATAEDTQIAGNGVLKDSFGRDIYLIEGIVLKGIMPGVVVTQKNLEDNHKHLAKYYREFWNYTTPNSTLRSESFDWYSVKTSCECLEYIKLKECNLKYKEKVSTETTICISSSEFVEQNNSWSYVDSKQLKNEISSVAFFPCGDLLAIQYEPQHQKVIVLNLREKKN